MGDGEEVCPIERAAVRLGSSGRDIVPLEEDRPVGDTSFCLDMGADPSDDSDGEDYSDNVSNSSAEYAYNVFFGDPFIDDDEEDGWDDDLQSPELSSDDEH